ncbi:2-C-methyl-D-erythritol 4-phosphate cytidylyltransferase [Saccharospirillum sp. MSK14-1]|uniref:2-C-methyl-D-erythritol 4-phosphate cytidylyltransferase n=1 Tax=Saccharospirillum sp. MSK14-1 TaxID=1897632 RepID=UPI000D358DCD|nr:2-C-methyl-D-erythritol 4-phosphate cytidylyltransferase [Saccharospirillum sp. MSK14-1]PTY37165.1 2-C-methyl-D-erythritol 4-phosphate cytidylyltransferase [Saccharospirillum sp. MSK14-1]
MTLHLLLPAAGIGQRFGHSTPKQYCQLAGKTVAEWTLDLWQHVAIDGQRLIVLREDDAVGLDMVQQHASLQPVTGGAERADSVLAGLNALDTGADDWVMVHDIARPCVRTADIDRLWHHCQSTGNGAILARPLTDTIKRQHDGRVSSLDRRQLWAAMTPQCFPVIALREALTEALAAGDSITDEASALERIGVPVDLVEGAADNIKLTRADDLALVEFYLRQQGRLA